MPFLSLPKDESALRFKDGEVSFHYLVSTPHCRTFCYANEQASIVLDNLMPRGPSSRGRWSSEAFKKATTALQSKLTSRTEKQELLLDARYPTIFFLPSECFSAAHLFAEQLCDATLASNFNLVAVDPRGHGLTRDIPIRANSQRKYDLDVKAADIAEFISSLCQRSDPTCMRDGKPRWRAGMHLSACSMSGLVSARLAARWPDAFESIMITSPVLEDESPFMIESFQGIKELVEQAWHQVRDKRVKMKPEEMKMPGEVVQGFSYRWAGEEAIPNHISSYLSRTWLERLVMNDQGLEAARDWWFDLYWLRRPMTLTDRNKVTCRVLIVEGDHDLPYERQVGAEIGTLFPYVAKLVYEVVEGGPFLLSVKRPHQLTQILAKFLGVGQTGSAEDKPSESSTEMDVKEVVQGLTAEERFELMKVYAPDCIKDAEDEDEDESEDESEEEEERVEVDEGTVGLRSDEDSKMNCRSSVEDERKRARQRGGWIERWKTKFDEK